MLPATRILALGWDSQLAQHARHIQQAPFVEFRRVEFQAADHVDGFGPATQFAQLVGVGFILRSDSRERGEEPAEKKSEPFIPRKGPVG